MGRLKIIRRRAVYLFVASFRLLLNIVPRKMALAFGSWIGLIIWTCSGRDRHRVNRHLRLAYAQRYSRRQRAIIGRRFYINSGKNLVDVMRFPRRFDSEILPLVKAEGIEHLANAYRRGHGVIGVTGHIGNFELAAGFVHAQGFRLAVIGRELSNPALDRLLLENRQSVGLTNFSTTDSPRRAVSWLRQGGMLGVLIDTDSHRVRSTFIPVWGRWSHTPIGQTILGLKTGAAFVPMVCLRTDDDRYKLIVRPEITCEPSGDFDQDVYRVTQLCTDAIREIIDQHPDQWPWQHNRWRTRRPNQP